MSVKTTVYLPDDLKHAVEEQAKRAGTSEAEVIRAALREHVGRARPQPRGGFLHTDAPMADRVEGFLAGFGE